MKQHRCLYHGHPDRQYEELAQLLAGELPLWRAIGVRRHMAHCADCTAVSSDIAGIWRRAREVDAADRAYLARTITGTGGLQDRIRQELQNMPDSSTSGVSSRPRRSYSATPFAVGLGVTALVATAACLLVTQPGGVLRPTVAFARVETAMKQVSTATWEETTYYPDKQRTNKIREHRNVAVRLDPPTRLYTISRVGDSARSKNTAKFLTTANGMITYTPWQRYYALLNQPLTRGKSSFSPEELRDSIRRSLVSPRVTDDPKQTPHTDAPFKWREMPWRMTKVTFRGHSTLRFVRHSTRYRDDTDWWKKQMPQEYTETVYADPTTFLVIRRELEQTKGIPGHMLTIRDNFRYNNLPASAFSIAPPVGQQILLEDMTQTGLMAPVPEETRQAAIATIQSLAEARKQGDKASYMSLWDFSYLPERIKILDASSTQIHSIFSIPTTPSLHQNFTPETYRTEIEKGFDKGGAYRNWHLGNVEQVTYERYLYTRRSEEESFPPTTPSDTVDVTVSLIGTLPSGQQEQRRALFAVRKTESGWRVANFRFFTSPPPRKKQAEKSGSR